MKTETVKLREETRRLCAEKIEKELLKSRTAALDLERALQELFGPSVAKTQTTPIYGGFTAIDDLKLNGKLTLGENTADNGGARVALAALMQMLTSAGKAAEKIDGYTPEQRRDIGVQGGLIGGRARADSLTKARRSEIAQKAAEARWAKKKKPEAPPTKG